MAVYLGSEKVGVVLEKQKHFASGTVTSDANGVVTFPELGFEPVQITIWNIKQTDHKAMFEAGETDDWEDYYVRYTYDGVLLTSIKQLDGVWISLSTISNSGSVVISNASFSANGEGRIFEHDGNYSYHTNRVDGTAANFPNTEFNYAIYG